MENYYTVTCSAGSCGKVSVTRQGLYYVFQCRCKPEDRQIYRLMLTCGHQQQSLGILVPADDGFGLTTRLPARQLPEGQWSFSIAPKDREPSGCFVPISPEEPFAYISRLKDSFLVYQNGQPGIITEKPQE